jgi:hypothetical protein
MYELMLLAGQEYVDQYVTKGEVAEIEGRPGAPRASMDQRRPAPTARTRAAPLTPLAGGLPPHAATT